MVGHARSQDTETVRVLLENGADVSMKDKGNRSALEHAKISRDEEIIRLIEKAQSKRRRGL